MAGQRGWRATFMTKPAGEAVSSSSGSHFSGALWSASGDRNAFHHPPTASTASPNGLSAVGRHWAGGLVRHARALTALLCPTVNCYRRLHRRHTPDVADCALENRGSMLRIVAAAASPNTTYIENRLFSKV